MRLESDEKAVRIITVHKSKGLEFDVVFCPYVWRRRQERDGFPRSGGGRSPHPRSGRRRPSQAAPGKGSVGRSVAAFLRRADAGEASLHDGFAPKTRTRKSCAGLSAWADAERPAMAASPNIAITEVPAVERRHCIGRPARSAAAPGCAREFTGAIDRTWGIASFTQAGQRTRNGRSR